MPHKWKETKMILTLRCLAIGILLICHYIVWVSTSNWYDFAMYVGIMNLVGIVIGIPAGLAAGKAMIVRRRERARLKRLKEMSGGE